MYHLQLGPLFEGSDDPIFLHDSEDIQRRTKPRLWSVTALIRFKVQVRFEFFSLNSLEVYIFVLYIF